jgi:adenylate cyclase
MEPSARFRRLATTLAWWWPGLSAAIVVITLVGAGWLEPFELWSLDRLFEARGTRVPQSPILLVMIDDSSFSELNVQWPFPREMHAQLIDRISAGQPLVIAFDIIFDSPSARGPGDDVALGASVTRAGNVVLGAAPTMDEGPVMKGLSYTRIDMNWPIPVIRTGAAAVGPVNTPYDSDGRIRRSWTKMVVMDLTVLGFDAAIHSVARRAGLPAAALPDTPTFLINFRGRPKTFPWVQYYRVLRGEVTPEAFRDKIVLIGPTSGLMHDLFQTPFARSGEMSGVEIHANGISTLIEGNPIREVPEWISTLVAVAAALAAPALVARLGALHAQVAVFGLWVVFTLGPFAAFSLGNVWMRNVTVLLAIVLGFEATVFEHFVRAHREAGPHLPANPSEP